MNRSGALSGVGAVVLLAWSGAALAKGGKPTFDPCGPAVAKLIGLLANAAEIQAEGAIASEKPGALEVAQQAASTINDLADKQARRGCTEIAHSLYMRVIDTFVGSAYAAQRQHAQIGLDDLRAAASTVSGPQR